MQVTSAAVLGLQLSPQRKVPLTILTRIGSAHLRGLDGQLEPLLAMHKAGDLLRKAPLRCVGHVALALQQRQANGVDLPPGAGCGVGFGKDSRSAASLAW